MRGRELAATDVGALEQRLEQDPTDLRVRAQLLGFYFTGQDCAAQKRRRRRHVLWVIEYAPQSALAGDPACELDAHLDRGAFGHASQPWRSHVAKNPRDLRILAHAASFFTQSDRLQAIALLERARDLDPKSPRWYERLAFHHGLGLSRKHGWMRLQAARRAHESMQLGLRLTAGPATRSAMLEDAAKYAFEAGELAVAEALAKELLGGVVPAGWDDGSAVHHGNLVLGRLALRAGDRKRAIEHLLAAGRTKGSPQLDSFGPNVMPAQELLEKGERGAVLEYFNLCAVFCGAEREELKRWAEQVRAGRIPDFGANLDY